MIIKHFTATPADHRRTVGTPLNTVNWPRLNYTFCYHDLMQSLTALHTAADGKLKYAINPHMGMVQDSGVSTDQKVPVLRSYRDVIICTNARTGTYCLFTPWRIYEGTPLTAPERVDEPLAEYIATAYDWNRQPTNIHHKYERPILPFAKRNMIKHYYTPVLCQDWLMRDAPALGTVTLPRAPGRRRQGLQPGKTSLAYGSDTSTRPAGCVVRKFPTFIGVDVPKIHTRAMNAICLHSPVLKKVVLFSPSANYWEHCYDYSKTLADRTPPGCKPAGFEPV